ncbi:ABC transporter substrate-binding protein [Bordetella sp. N]|uniref:ABC transporter substrate-binding protein n=1 Tax=Bordetella sp. N TaxID=1746199 RepID=UPI00070D1D59|nr:ABC transporter substrate-binding protein [Bordetella sp. N]ALM82364.1 branched-chain amino acid ABC transporter substrate-binding protein [Bordetella sp. N]
MKLLAQFLGASAVLLALSGTSHAQQARPVEIRLGMSTFMTGAASVLGAPAKAAADMWIEDFNAAGGIDGVKLKPTWIDEGQGADKFLSDYRRLAQEPGEKVMISAISSGYCNALAPVAEDLKVVNILWECSTEKVLEDRRYKYVFRTGPNGTMEMVAAVLQLLRTKPDFKTIAVVNQDYAWGRDSWEVFRNTLLALKPDVKIVAELFPKFGAPDFSTEVTRLQALRPDVVLSTAWGGDLDTFLRQASQRGLLKNSQFILPLADSSLERLGDAIPPGVIVGFVGDGYFADPEYANDPETRAFVQKFKQRTGAYPNFAVYHMIQALKATTGAYKHFLADNGGKWPSAEQLATTLRGSEYRGLSRPIRMREDGQALQGQLLGITRKDPSQAFPLVGQLTFYPADIVAAPVGQKSVEWVKSLKPDLVQNAQIKRVGN